MQLLLYILLMPLATYLALAGLYQFILAVASHKTLKVAAIKNSLNNRFLVLVPAYKADAVILHSTVKNIAMKYQYPKSHFDYVVIADQLKQSTIAGLKANGAQVHEVSFEKSTKVKALQSAMAKYSAKDYDGVVILDADNVVEDNFLNKANSYLNRGYNVIQGNRKSANSNTTFALLDGLSETANTQLLCKGANALGLSSKLSGSGMVFTIQAFEKAIYDLTAIGGFDKEMELFYTQAWDYIQYADDLVVYDEKIASAGDFSKQRGRWLEAQYSFLKKSIKPALRSLSIGNLDHVHKVAQLALPPRALAPFALLMLVVAGLFTNQTVLITSLIGFVALSLSYLLVLPSKTLKKQFIPLLMAFPSLIASAIGALGNIKKSRKGFIHTPHKLVKT
ncbi:glycosyltransferase family 2 protein [Roseivirga pacifica]|uniref:glycosyltransferase family 2 protein n=1 Tax=Roseivirga pacifica TaxID=1267423 RepID=UPI00227C908A|nr:glycosyltransferase family 2 protein [Roseivirga pacifica]